MTGEASTPGNSPTVRRVAAHPHPRTACDAPATPGAGRLSSSVPHTTGEGSGRPAPDTLQHPSRRSAMSAKSVVLTAGIALAVVIAHQKVTTGNVPSVRLSN